MRAIDAMHARCGPWAVGDGQKRHDGWSLLGPGLLATLACLSMDKIATLLQVHRATAARNVLRHSALMRDAPYAARAGHAARAAIDRTFEK